MRSIRAGRLIGILLGMLAVTAQAGEGVLDSIQPLRSESFRVCADILLGYDPYAREFDRGKAGEYQAGLAKLDELSGAVAVVSLRTEQAVFLAAARELEARPTDVSAVAINNVLEAQARLLDAADQLYAQQTRSGQEAKQQLHALSMASARMLILYQIRPYGGLIKYPGLPIDEEGLTELDRQIRSGMDALRQREGALAQQIAVLEQNYAFVRPRIFDAQKQLVTHGVNYYLGRNIVLLDSLARGM